MRPIRSVPMCLPQSSSSRMGHGRGGIARHACRAPRPTNAVTLRAPRVPPWQTPIVHSGHVERVLVAREDIVQVFPRENSVYCSRPAALAQAGTGLGISLLSFGSFARWRRKKRELLFVVFYLTRRDPIGFTAVRVGSHFPAHSGLRANPIFTLICSESVATH